MTENGLEWVTVDDLRVGLFVELESGWLDHPFPSGSFKISSTRQIDTLRELGLPRVRVNLGKSDPLPAVPQPVAPTTGHPQPPGARPPPHRKPPRVPTCWRCSARGLQACERRFNDSVKLYRKTLEQVHSHPHDAALQCLTMVNTVVDELLQEGESAIRLLSESAGDKTSMHSVNTAIVALLLGQALGLPRTELVDLGMAAFCTTSAKPSCPTGCAGSTRNSRPPKPTCTKSTLPWASSSAPRNGPLSSGAGNDGAAPRIDRWHRLPVAIRR